MAAQGVAGKVTTLSAAMVAQNMAMFLKNYSDWMCLTLMNESSYAQQHQQQQQPPPNMQQPHMVSLKRIHYLLS